MWKTAANSLRLTVAIIAAWYLSQVVGFVPRAQAAEADDAAWTMAAAVDVELENSDYEEAERLLASLMAMFPEHPGTYYVTGKLFFHQGKYQEALAQLQRGSAIAPVASMLSNAELVRETIDVVKDFATYRTRDGLFEIRYDARRDAVLIPWAEETLEKAYYEIGYDLGYWPEPPIRVEIYPKASYLARVSSLTEEAIKASGTIALCKYNKLMFTSPRATARGYSWRTTIAHEYVHYAISHLTHESDVPIWLHEAIAKYLEVRWTGDRENVLEPSREELLSERVEANNLITFEQMHPSMAYLPTPEDASTAYAEVFTVMEYLVSRRGPGVIREILYKIRAGTGVIPAIEETSGESFEVFERNWMTYLRARPRVDIPGDFDEEVQLVPEATSDESVDQYQGLGSPAAKDYLMVGELLRARNMPEAALVQYQKAETLIGTSNPLVQSALAQTWLDLAQPDRALSALSDVATWYPTFYRSFLLQGQALNQLRRHSDAMRALENAVSINPFDPAVHREMATAWVALGDATLAARAREFETQVTP